MAFGFGDLMSKIGSGADQLSNGLGAMRDLPLNQKMMMVGQTLNGSSDPLNMLGAISRLGQNPGGIGTATSGSGVVPMNMLGMKQQPVASDPMSTLRMMFMGR